MYLERIQADGIYGIFNFDISFDQKLNIIIGPNGVGKTTVLKIILAIFNLDYSFLGKLKFQTIEISVSQKSNKIKIILQNYRISGNNTLFDVYSETLGVDYTVVLRKNQLFEIITNSSDFDGENLILNLGKPMFLGLDRRFVFEQNEQTEVFVSQYLLGEKSSELKKEDPLDSIIDLIQSHALANRKKLFRASTQLRNNLIRNLLEKTKDHLKPELLLNIYKASEKYEKVKKSLSSLSLSKDIHQIIKERLNEYANLSEELKGILNLFDTKKDLAQDQFSEFKDEISGHLIDYYRLDKILDLLEAYKQRNDEIFHNINAFQDLINPFFEKTDKSLFINFEGILKVKKDSVTYDISILSSGERQLVILIGNLVFNKNLIKNRLFIIDEPELSLHIAWQEIFIDTLLKEEKGIQFILATHSPAIVDKYAENLTTVNNKQSNVFKKNVIEDGNGKEEI